MTLLIISDSHGRVDRLRSVFELHKNADALIFLGDGLTDLDRAGVNDYRFTVFALRGNCDFRSTFLSAEVAKVEKISIGGYNILLTHGDLYGAKSGDGALINLARRENADILLFGHTHEPIGTYVPEKEYNLNKPMHLFNPGSLAEYSYGLCEIRNGQLLFSHGTAY